MLSLPTTIFAAIPFLGFSSIYSALCDYLRYSKAYWRLPSHIFDSAIGIYYSMQIDLFLAVFAAFDKASPLNAERFLCAREAFNTLLPGAFFSRAGHYGAYRLCPASIFSILALMSYRFDRFDTPTTMLLSIEYLM